MFAGIKAIFGGIFKLISKTKFWLPKGFTPVFLIWQLISDVMSQGWNVAAANFATRLLSAEYVIQKNVNIAINTPELYSVVNFFEIVNSFFVIYFFIKFLVWLINRTFSLNPNLASYIASVIIFVAIEYIWILTIGAFTVENYTPTVIDSTVKYIEPTFIPFKDGVLYLIMNYKAVVTLNMFKFW